MACCFSSSSGLHDPDDSQPQPIDDSGRVRATARFSPLLLPRRRCWRPPASRSRPTPPCCSHSSLLWQVEDLRRRLSGIIPPVDVQWGAQATVNTSGISGSGPGGGGRPTTPLGAFERRQSVSLRPGASGGEFGFKHTLACGSPSREACALNRAQAAQHQAPRSTGSCWPQSAMLQWLTALQPVPLPCVCRRHGTAVDRLAEAAGSCHCDRANSGGYRTASCS